MLAITLIAIKKKYLFNNFHLFLRKIVVWGYFFVGVGDELI